MSGAYPSFGYGVEGAVATITLARPDRLNALTFAVYEELGRAFDDLQAAGDVRAVLVRGEGRAFCSGGDVEDIIGELFARDMQGLLAFTRLTGALIAKMRKLRKPIVAEVGGVAAGAGAVIALASDFRVASDKARFAFLFPKVGLCGADMGAGYLLPRIVGLGHASRLLFLGETVGADEARAMGLVHSVVPAAELEQAARDLAERLASGPAFAHAMTKEMLEKEARMSLDEAIEAEAQAQAICMQHPDFRSAFEAWKEKRAVTFAGAPGPFRG